MLCFIEGKSLTSVGRFSLFSKNHQFSFFTFLCENRDLKKYRGLQDSFWISKFLKEKKIGSQAWQFSAIQEQLVFLAGSHKLDLKNFNIFIENYFLNNFFDKKVDFEYIFSNT